MSEHRRALALITALFLFLGFVFQGTRALWETDEGRYTENAIQMVTSGDYLVPRYNEETPNFTKPPFTLWSIAASVNAFGHSTWAVRTPYAIAFTLIGLLLFGMGRRVVPDRPWLPPLVYGLSLFPFGAANYVSTDVFLTLWEGLAMYGYLASLYAATPSSRSRYITLMWIGFGAAFLTKGPPGLLPLFAILAYTVICHGRSGLRPLFRWPGLLLFLVIGFGWYLTVIAFQPGLFRYFLVYEVYDRLFTGVHHRHAAWYGWIVAYGPPLVLGTLPWWFPLARGLRRALSRERWRTWVRERSVVLLLLLWFLIPLVVFVLAKSRLPLYVLPLFLPLSLMIALQLRRTFDPGARRTRVLLAVWILALVAFKGGFAYFVKHPERNDRILAAGVERAASGHSFDSVTYVDQHMPWGVRFYLRRPLHALDWFGQQDPDCEALTRRPDTLFLVAYERAENFRRTAEKCNVSLRLLGEAENDGRRLRAAVIPGTD